ncbi:polA [Symbiodinium natans]|uniref:DNA-directed DNA polymerase n=1 Tax=Symbiodinium natans TaxID=878477 RepID=A0A812U1N4_9DINO|nr:polA [Symbiodinium natans]
MYSWRYRWLPGICAELQRHRDIRRVSARENNAFFDDGERRWSPTAVNGDPKMGIHGLGYTQSAPNVTQVMVLGRTVAGYFISQVDRLCRTMSPMPLRRDAEGDASSRLTSTLDGLDYRTWKLPVPDSYDPLAGAVTGRMTCANPNLQSSPRMEEFRGLFRAGLRPGWDWLVQGDFSQIELRVLAELAEDEQMQGIFAAGEDLHATTAALLSGVAPAEVSSQQRQFAKAVNFGLVYGQSAEGLQKSAENSYGIELSYAEACRARQGFLAAYPAVAEWQQRQRDLAMRGAEVRTKGGRPACHLVEQWKDLQGGHCDASSSGRLQREAINFPVQGTAAEVMMACLESLHAFLQRASATVRLVCVVHDEFLLECADPAAAEEAVGALREAMEDAWRRLFPGAVLGATGISVRKGLSWSELK